MYWTLDLASKFSIEDLWPDYPTKDDFLWNEDEY